jgi:cyclophilin family peptidyl-prolyl cis-trans isomerase/HEAT repeat protein
MKKAAVAGMMLAVGVSGSLVLDAQRGRQPERERARELTRRTILEIEDSRAPTDGDLRTLLQATRVADVQLRTVAIRALGRLERRDVIADLLPFLPDAPTRAETGNALAQALRGARLSDVPTGQQEQTVLDALLAAGATELTSRQPVALTAVARSMGRLPFTTAEQRESAETFLRRVLDTPFPHVRDEPHIGAARGLESLVRLNRKVHRLDDRTVEKLREFARSADATRLERRHNALLALAAAQGIDRETVQAIRTGEPEVRRLAVLALTGAGFEAPEDERLRLHREFLSDRSPMVRFEALRGWVSRGVRDYGCQPLIDALSDDQLQVVLAAIDALGDHCRDDPSVTARIEALAKPAPMTGNWHTEAHAIVSLAKRAPDRAAIRMTSFAEHARWQVRLYAARAAVQLDDVDLLTKLADDPDDNVVEAVLPALRRRVGSESDPLFVAALNRKNRTVGRHVVRPYQVIRAAAMTLQGAQSTPALVGALGDALERITEEQCETSRDVRLALVARLDELASPNQAGLLVPLLRDIDLAVATAAAAVVSRWTGKQAVVDPPPLVIRAAPAEAVQRSASSVLVEMEDEKSFEIRFLEVAPYARARFLDLVRKGYYDDLTFHRIATNFVIQGGSPNANEYCGDCPFARDEVGLATNRRGTIGVSTRGRDTGDSQIFVNLLDSPRLDHTYTVFAMVCQDRQKDGMEVVDAIQEGDRMRRVTVITPGKNCR